MTYLKVISCLSLIIANGNVAHKHMAIILLTQEKNRDLEADFKQDKDKRKHELAFGDLHTHT